MPAATAIRAAPDWYLRLQAPLVDFPAFCRQAGIPARQCPRLGARNRRSHSALTWDDLERADAGVAAGVRRMARRYGYRDWRPLRRSRASRSIHA